MEDGSCWKEKHWVGEMTLVQFFEEHWPGHPCSLHFCYLIRCNDRHVVRPFPSDTRFEALSKLRRPRAWGMESRKSDEVQMWKCKLVHLRPDPNHSGWGQTKVPWILWKWQRSRTVTSAWPRGDTNISSTVSGKVSEALIALFKILRTNSATLFQERIFTMETGAPVCS